MKELMNELMHDWMNEWLHVSGMTGPANSFTARGPVTLTAILFPQPGCHEIDTNISSAYEN